MVDKDFQEFLITYQNGNLRKLVDINPNNKMEVDLTSKDNFAKFLEKLEKEIIDTNINLLYAYHQWLKSKHIF